VTRRRDSGTHPVVGPVQRVRAVGPRKREEGVRAAAAWVLDRTLASMAPAESFLVGVQGRFDERDQSLLRDLVLGSLRWLRRLDDVLREASHRDFDEIEPALRNPLRLGVYQLLFHDRVPHHAAVNEAVELALRATHRGGASFANAVLRRIARAPRLADWPVRESDPIKRLAIEWSHPDFLVERWLERYGSARTLELLQVNNRQRPLHLLAFRQRGGRELLAEALIDEGLEVTPSALAPLGLTVRAGDAFATRAFGRGDFYAQDEASQVAALVPPPRDGEWVLDAAAAPGGKTFAILSYEPGARAVASDASLERLLVLRQNARRLGIALPLVVADGGAPPFGVDGDARFDRVILDLPCSGTGTLRKHPEIRWRLSPGEITRLADDGLRLALGAAPAVKAGGLLVLVTCSIEREENEDVVRRFLSHRADFRTAQLVDLPPSIASAVTDEGAWRLLPSGDHDGFSVHVLERAPRATDARPDGRRFDG
jgi:16S rRNA (cytosine967-C5)-methyltransferase